MATPILKRPIKSYCDLQICGPTFSNDREDGRLNWSYVSQTNPRDVLRYAYTLIALDTRKWMLSVINWRGRRSNYYDTIRDAI